jgi:hypothetical protein
MGHCAGGRAGGRRERIGRMFQSSDNPVARQGLAVRAARTAGHYVRGNWRSYAAAGVAGVFLSLVGAFGTDVMPVAMRLLYWVSLMLAGAAMGHVVGAVTARRPRIGENRWLLWATVTVLVSLPITLVVWLITGALIGRCETADLPYYFGTVLLVSAAMTAITMLVNAPGPATHGPPAGAPAPQVRFLQRLPAKIMGGAIWAVEAEDHYLRVRTSKGSDLILMRLADAMAELEGIEGAQVHRSWWVARAGVADVKRDGPRVTLVLKDGGEAPVSRPNVKPLREAGWF